MKKDIENKEAEGVFLAIAKRLNDDLNEDWYVYLINENQEPIETVLINTKGYGEVDGKEKEASVMRYRIDKLDPNQYATIEPIMPELFKLTNEFWVTYFQGGHMYDKKFIFPAHSVGKELIDIPQLGLKGVLHV